MVQLGERVGMVAQAWVGWARGASVDNGRALLGAYFWPMLVVRLAQATAATMVVLDHARWRATAG